MSNPELEAQKQQCPFCRIIRGEIPSKVVYDDGQFIGILDINPARRGHVIILPKEHYPMLPMMEPKDFLHMGRMTRKLYAAVRDAFLADGMTLMMANGGVAGQQVGHFCFHLIPRDKGDGLDQFSLPTKEIKDPKIDQIEQGLKQNLKLMIGNYYPRAQLPIPEGLQEVLSEKPSLEQLAEMVKQNPQIKEMILNNRPQFEQLAKTHPQLQPLFAGVNLDELIKLL